MKYTISGDNLLFVNIEFQPGEMIYSEAGSMVYISEPGSYELDKVKPVKEDEKK